LLEQHLLEQASLEAVPSKVAVLSDILELPEKHRRKRPFDANKRDDARVKQAFRSAVKRVGEIICPGEGAYLLSTLKSYERPQRSERFQHLLQDNVRVLLVTTNEIAFKIALGTLCSSMTHEELNQLLTVALQLTDDSGNYKLAPRLGRWRKRLAKHQEPMGRHMFTAGRKLYAFWREEGMFPKRFIKCRVNEDKIYNLCKLMFTYFSKGWRPSVSRPRLVGNAVICYPYYLRNADIVQMERMIYADNSTQSNILAGRKALRLITYLITEPMATKECLSYFYTRFMMTCSTMYVDLLTQLRQRIMEEPKLNGM
jgi:hypothetical protein